MSARSFQSDRTVPLQRLRWATASAIAIALPALLLAAAPTSAAVPSRSGRCPRGQALYPGARNEPRCRSKRTKQLWYRIAMDVIRSDTFTGGRGNSSHSEETEHWLWKSNTAVLLYRQCSVPTHVLDQQEQRSAAGWNPAIPCRLQYGHPREDLSWNANGVAKVVAYTHTATQQGSDCSPEILDTRLTAPSKVVSSLGTQSAAFDGIAIGFDLTRPYTAGRAVFTNSGFSCQAPPTSPPEQPAPPTVVPGFSDTLNLDPRPDIEESPYARFGNSAAQFGAEEFSLNAAVVRKFHFGDGGTRVRTAKFTIRLHRCPGNGGAHPAGC